MLSTCSVGPRPHSGRLYSGTLLTSGEDLTTSLNKIIDQIASGTFGALNVRFLERVTGTINAGLPHAVPPGFTFVSGALSGSGRLVLYWRGTLRDPGFAASNDDYEETSATEFTPYNKIKVDDHINYFFEV